jgi:probable HAF family extracellular repeat protein
MGVLKMSARSVLVSIRCYFIAITSCVASVAYAADFTPLGSLPDPNFFTSAAHAVTADGRTIAGESVVFRLSVGDRQAVQWRNGAAPSSLGYFGFNNIATALSADGNSAIGRTESLGYPGGFAFYWSDMTGPIVPVVLPGFTNSAANAISTDGSTMVGELYNIGPPWSSSDQREAFRWSRSGNYFFSLGYLAGGSNTSSNAYAVSADGSVIVGMSTSANADHEAFRWTQDTGLVALGFLPGGTGSVAQFVSDDGLVIAGATDFLYDSSRRAVFRWTEATGMVDIGALPGAVTTFAHAMSRDGRFIVGRSGAEAFRWNEADGMISLGRLPDDQESAAIAVSDDGAVILGWSYYSDGHSDYFVWTEAGLRTLRDLLMASGVDISSWQNLQAEALSRDGNTIVGQGTNPTGNREGWRIRLQGNRAPIANIGYSLGYPLKRQAISFYGTGSTDPDGDEIRNYRWDFGDGTTAVGPVVSHTYAEAGNHVVTLLVSDGEVDSVPAILELPVYDSAPNANIGGPYTGTKNLAIRFDGTASYDGDNDPLTYAWDFGDGVTASGANPMHAYAQSGTYTVALIVNDGSADSIPARIQATVSNTAPVAKMNGPASAFKLSTLTWDGSGSSDGNGDALTYHWDFGDGSNATVSTPTTTHSFATVGSYLVTLTVNDGEANSSPVSANVVIQSRPPVANAGPDQSVIQRKTVRLNGGASTDPDGLIASVRWRQVVGPTVALSGSTTLSPTFVAPRVLKQTTLSFELTVTDNDGLSSSDTVDVNVSR